MTWLDVVRDFARSHGVEDRWLVPLSALASPWPRGGPPAPPERSWSGSFADLERAELGRPVLTDVDSAQAATFLRRVDAVEAELLDLGGPEARVLRVGLRVRLAGMAQAEGPQAIRVRALADFYYSQAARLASVRAGRIHPLEAVVAGVIWRELQPGAEHAVLDGDGPEGPLHVNLVRLDPARFELQVVDLRATDGDLARVAREAGAPVATSGGFFLYSEPDIEPPSQQGDPVGLFASGGALLNPPYLPRGALISGPAGVEVGVVRCASAVVTRADARFGPDRESVAMVGNEVVARGTQLPIPLNGAVLVGLPEVQQLTLDGAPVEIREGVAGGPVLLRDGEPCIDLRAEGFWGTAPPVTFSQDETGDQNLLPRLAVGLDREGRVILAAVDGRNFAHALGMTLSGVASLMQHLGCRVAVNLDGGSSKRMVVEGQEVDLPSTEIRACRGTTRVRPVRTGILWLPRKMGASEGIQST